MCHFFWQTSLLITNHKIKISKVKYYNSKRHSAKFSGSLMARGVALRCCNGRKSSTLLYSSIAKVSLSFSPKTLFASFPIQPRRQSFSRLFCNLSSVPNTVDEKKYKEVFNRRMAMAGLKPHHRIGISTNWIESSMLLYKKVFLNNCVYSSFGSFRWAW